MNRVLKNMIILLITVLLTIPNAIASGEMDPLNYDKILGQYQLREVYIDGIIYANFSPGMIVNTGEYIIQKIPEDTLYPETIVLMNDKIASITNSNQKSLYANWEMQTENIHVFIKGYLDIFLSPLSSGTYRICIAGNEINGARYERFFGFDWDTPKQLSKQTNIDDVVIWGKYEQDSNIRNGPEPIEWIVIKHENDRYLLLSKYILDYLCFDEEETKTWEDSSIRNWLNHEFLTTSFSPEEVKLIVPINIQSRTGKVKEGRRTYYQISETQDQVFLLSSNKEELDQYRSYYYWGSILLDVPLRTLYSKLHITEKTDMDWCFRDTENGLVVTWYWHKMPANTLFGIRPLIWVDLDE